MPTVSNDIDAFLNAADNAAARTALGAGEPFTPLEITEAPPEDLEAIRAALGAGNFSATVEGSLITSGLDAIISTSGGNASIYTEGSNAYIYTTGANAGIYTTGANSPIYTIGANSSIYTQGANANIQSRGTLRLFDGTYVTSISHAPTASRTTTIGDATGVLPVVPAYADLTAANSALDSGDFWWDTTLKKLRTATA